MVITSISSSTSERTKSTPGVGWGGTGARPNGNGSRGPKNNGGGGDRNRSDFSPQQYRIGMWVVLAAVMMMFAALTSAYVFRADRTQSWQSFEVPSLMWVSTALILISSVTYEMARRALKKDQSAAYRTWLIVSLLLGLGFLVSQLLAWQQLVAQGIYLATNPHSSFFYLLTALHALHLILGIFGLSYLWLRTLQRVRHDRADRQGAAKEQARADAMGIYWHFMDGLWVYLFALLFLWR